MRGRRGGQGTGFVCLPPPPLSTVINRPAWLKIGRNPHGKHPPAGNLVTADAIVRDGRLEETPLAKGSLFQVQISKQIPPPPPASGWWTMEEAGHMKIDQATQIRQAGGRRLLSKTEQTVGSELMRGKGQMRYRALRPERIQRRWKFLNPDLHPGRGPHVPCPGEWGGSQAVRNRPQNEEGRRTKVTRRAMEKSTKLKQLKTAKILTYQNESSMEKFDEAWEAQKSGR